MTVVRRHLLAVAATLFALAVGIALGGGPFSYVSDDAPAAADDAGASDGSGQDPVAEPPPANDAFVDAFATNAAARVYGGALLGHPTAIVALPGVDPAVLEAMVAEVPLAGGGLTGVFQLADAAVDRDETANVDELTGQVLAQLDDDLVDPNATTYARLGQLTSLAVATPIKKGRAADGRATTVRTALGAGGLLTAPPEARLAPLVLVLLPEGDGDGDDVSANTAIYQGLTTGLALNAAGVVLVGDTASAQDGLLAELRDDELVSSTVATVDGGDTAIGRVTAMLALISSLRGSVGAYGAAGSDGAAPIS